MTEAAIKWVKDTTGPMGGNLIGEVHKPAAID